MVSGRDWSQDWALLPHQTLMIGPHLKACRFQSIDTDCREACYLK